MKDLAFALGQNKTNLFLVLASKKGGKPVISCYISKELVARKRLQCWRNCSRSRKAHPRWWRWSSLFATAGGKNPDGIAAALAAANDLV